jgi:hypothetical protein
MSTADMTTEAFANTRPTGADALRYYGADRGQPSAVPATGDTQGDNHERGSTGLDI